MQSVIFSFISIISLFLTVMLSVFFFLTRKGTILENRILAILLMVFSIQIIYSFATSFYGYKGFMGIHKELFLLRMSTFLIGPLIYLYVVSFLKKGEVFRVHNLLHLLPFASFVLFLLVLFTTIDRFVIWESILDLDFTILILLHNLVYITYAFIIMHKNTDGFREFFRRSSMPVQHRWLQLLLLGFIIIWIVNLNSFALYMIIQRPGWCAYTASIYALMVFIFINSLMFVLLFRPDAYYFISKYKHTRINEPDKQEYLARLNTYMEAEQPYLNPDITIEMLANELSLNPRILSQIINETYKKNFKSYILEYRIRESMKILSDRKHAKLTILEVLYQVGFNSKSAFNNQFKLYTNLTPLEYRSRTAC